jgi:hypothetical protein
MESKSVLPPIIEKVRRARVKKERTPEEIEADKLKMARLRDLKK